LKFISQNAFINNLLSQIDIDTVECLETLYNVKLVIKEQLKAFS